MTHTELDKLTSSYGVKKAWTDDREISQKFLITPLRNKDEFFMQVVTISKYDLQVWIREEQVEELVMGKLHDAAKEVIERQYEFGGIG